MEGKRMDDVIKTMTQDNDVLELMSILQLYDRRKEAEKVYELTSYIDSLEDKLNHVIDELNTVRKQLAEIKELSVEKSLKNVLTETAGKLEDSCKEMKDQIFKIKLEVKIKSKEIVKTIKEKGIIGLNQLSEFLGIKKMLKSVKSRLERDMIQVESALEKIDAAGLEMKKAAAGMKNATRALFGKPLTDIKEKNGFSISDIIKAPWKINQKLFAAMLKSVEGAIKNTEILAKEAGQIKHNVQKYSKVNEELKEKTALSMAGGSHKYNSEAYEIYEKTISTYNKSGLVPANRLLEQDYKR